MRQVHGNLEGIRKNTIERIALLYERFVGRDAFLPADLAGELAELTALMRREISVYISREGKVLNVSVGFLDSVTLPVVMERRGGTRLSRVRCVHTHPQGLATLSDVDLAALRIYRLDAMCALGVDDRGSISGLSVAFPTPEDEAPRVWSLSSNALDAAGQKRLMDEIRLSEESLSYPTAEETDASQERAWLVGIGDSASLDELASLCDSAGAIVVGRTWQAKGQPDPVSFVGSGKARELALDTQVARADLLVVDDEITASQAARLEEFTGLRTIDRTALILDIFAQRAKTREGRLQVELAQLIYRSSHLIGSRSALSRLGGGIGTRGPGETKLEVDRRTIRNRITVLRRELDELKTQRAVRRKNRERSGIPVIALVGYTNTGKSSLLNRLSGAEAHVRDQLFATLDPISRKLELPGGESFVLVDSVGFISKLPTQLVEAFRSTLEESMLAEVLVLVSDASNPGYMAQRRVVEEVLASLEAVEQPRIDVLNKCDLAVAEEYPTLPSALRVSAKTGEGVDLLLEAIAEALRHRERRVSVFVPFSSYAAVGDLRRIGRVLWEEHEERGTRAELVLDAASLGRLQSIPGIEMGQGRV